MFSKFSFISILVVAVFIIGAIGASAAEKDLQWDNLKSSPEPVANHNDPVSGDLILEDVLTESFNTWYPAGWDQVITNANYTWFWATASFNSPPASAQIEYDPALVPQSEWMITPALDMSTAQSPVDVSFWFLTSYYWHVDPNDNGDMQIRVSTDNGITWSNPLWTEDEYGVFDNWVWYDQTVNIDQVIGFPEVKVAFVYEGVDGAQANFDDIVISAEMGPGLDHDVAPIAFLSPGPSAGAPVDIEVKFKNFGANMESFEGIVSIEFNSTEVYNENVSIDDLASGAEINVDFPSFTPANEGIYEITAISSLNTDQNTENDEIMTEYDTNPVSGVFYDFEANDGGFSGTNDWEYGSPSAGPSGAYSGSNLWGIDIGGQYTVGPLLSALTTEPIDLGNDPVMTFYHWYHTENTYDGGNVKISTDGGNWTLITPAGGYDGPLDNSYENPIGGENAFYGGPNPWQQETFDLSAYEGETVMFKFDYGSDNSVVTGYGWYLDDFFVEFITTDIDDPVRVPLSFKLDQNYPNPFNASTNISFSLDKSSEVDLTIYNMLGQKVATLVSGTMPAGDHQINWNASEVNSGVYFYRLTAGENVSVQRMTLVK